MIVKAKTLRDAFAAINMTASDWAYVDFRARKSDRNTQTAHAINTVAARPEGDTSLNHFPVIYNMNHDDHLSDAGELVISIYGQELTRFDGKYALRNLPDNMNVEIRITAGSEKSTKLAEHIVEGKLDDLALITQMFRSLPAPDIDEIMSFCS